MTFIQNKQIEPFTHAYAITKHNSDFQSGAPFRKGIYVGGAGDLGLVTVGGCTVTFSAVPAGTFIPGQFIRLNATNTTATLVLGLN